MPLEISPVLAGTYDAPDYVPPHNIASAQSDEADEVDSRRYTKFDRSATDAGSNSNFSFGDFLDMINPLEHIPVISSIYREIAGENISPVSRVAGDILYGAAAGIASGVVSAVGAVGNSVIESQTGKDTTGNVIAGLFEDGKSPSPAATQLAQANALPTSAVPSTQKTSSPAQANARAKLMAAALAADAASAAQASMPSTGTSSPAAQMATASSATGSGLLQQLAGNPGTGLPLNANNPKMFVLPPRNLPYGGVMAPPLQGSNMAVSLANSAPGLQMNHMVYTGLKSGVKPSVPSPSVAVPAPPPVSAVAANTEPPAYVSTAGPNNLPTALMSDIAAMRAINSYRSTASQNTPSGPGVNVVN